MNQLTGSKKYERRAMQLPFGFRMGYHSSMILKSQGTVAVIGQGYVGLPLAISASKSGWNVIGIEILEFRVEKLNQGRSDIVTVDNKELCQAIESGRYKATSNFAEVAEADVIVLCLPTPLNAQNEPDLGVLLSGVTAISPHIKEGALVISESTSFPGTLRDVIVKKVQLSSSNRNKEIHFAVAPERVNPGDKNWTLGNTPRIVGGISPTSRTKAIDFYETFCDQVVVADSPEEAEAAKILENSFRLLNISFINEFSRICKVAKLDTNSVIELAATKPYGFMPFWPGIGAGGHCIPVDPLYYTFWARELGQVAELIEVSARINSEIPIQVAKRAYQLLDSKIRKPKIFIIGLAYKSGTSDFRESPAIRIAEEVSRLGADVLWHDPMVTEWRGSACNEISEDCDLIIYAVEQTEIDLNEIVSKGKPVLNCTRVKFDSPLVHQF